MASNTRGQTSLWFVYFVTITLGITFSIHLLSRAWNNALESNKREFSLQSISLKESVARNVRAAHNAANSISAFFLANPDLDQKQFLTGSREW